LKIEVKLAPILAALIISSQPVSSQGLIETNEQIVISSVRKAVVESLRTETFHRMSVNLTESGIERPVSNGIVNALRDMGVEVLADGSGDDGAERMVYDLLGFDFTYERGESRGFLRKPMIRREFAAQLRITVKAPPSGRIIFLNEIGVEYKDSIAPGFLDLARSRDIPELDPDPPGSGWIKIAEPAIVTVAVGALVYLFFANR
jgi:hypothetical protein